MHRVREQADLTSASWEDMAFIHLILFTPQGKSDSGFSTGTFTFCFLSLGSLKFERVFRGTIFETPPLRGRIL